MRSPRLARLLLPVLSLLPLVPACGEPDPIDDRAIATLGREIAGKVERLSAALARLPDATAYPTGVVLDGDPERFYLIGKMHLSGGWVDVDGSAGLTSEGSAGMQQWITVDVRLDGYTTAGEPPLAGSLHVNVKRAASSRVFGTVKGRVRAGDEDAVAVEVEL